MQQFELLKTAESILQTLGKNNIDPKDVRYLPMFADYRRLKCEGHKMCYIAYYLSQEYSCGEATVYRVIKRMQQEIL